jgi:hypothetical protein
MYMEDNSRKKRQELQNLAMMIDDAEVEQA